MILSTSIFPLHTVYTYLSKYWLFIIIFQREIMRKKHEMKRAQPGEFNMNGINFERVKFLYLPYC